MKAELEKESVQLMQLFRREKKFRNISCMYNETDETDPLK